MDWRYTLGLLSCYFPAAFSLLPREQPHLSLSQAPDASSPRTSQESPSSCHGKSAQTWTAPRAQSLFHSPLESSPDSCKAEPLSHSGLHPWLSLPGRGRFTVWHCDACFCWVLQDLITCSPFPFWVPSAVFTLLVFYHLTPHSCLGWVSCKTAPLCIECFQCIECGLSAWEGGQLERLLSARGLGSCLLLFSPYSFRK